MSSAFVFPFRCVRGLCLLGWFAAVCFFSVNAHANGNINPGELGVLRQAHHFDDPGSPSSISLFVMSGILGAADVVLIVGNITSMVTKRHARVWGGVGMAAGIVTALGLIPLYAEEGGAWWLLPAIPAAVVLGVSLANLLMGPRHKKKHVPRASAHQAKTTVPYHSVVLLRAGD
jgi:hypothetical protein